MSPSLRDFVSKAVEHDRILFGDLRRLQRDILPARITTREEAEALIALDRVRRADRAWREYLVVTIRDFVVWGLSPAGQMDRAKAEWLISSLSRHASTKTARVITREIVREAHKVDQILLAFARGPRSIARLPMPIP